MLVEPLPGVGLERLRNTLTELSTRLVNARATAGTATDVYNAYIRWVNDAIAHLSVEVSPSDLDTLILSQRCWLLQSMPDRAAIEPVRHFLNTEIADRLRVLDTAIAAIRSDIDRWQQPGALAVLDSSFYISHPSKLEEADFGSVLSIRDQPVRIVIPILVIDELDNLKRSGNSQVRWRAGYTLAVFDRVMSSASVQGVLHQEDLSALRDGTGGIPRGPVNLVVLFDPPRHTRLPIADDEIVARTAAVESRVNRPVRLVTYDTGQAMRARAAGLNVIKLSSDVGAEPTTRT